MTKYDITNFIVFSAQKVDYTRKDFADHPLDPTEDAITELARCMRLERDLPLPPHFILLSLVSATLMLIEERRLTF